MATDDEQSTTKATSKDRSTDEEQDQEHPDGRTAKKRTRHRGEGGSDRRDGSSSSRTRASKRPKPLQLARSASEQLAELTGRDPEGTTGIERTEDGWRIELEVVETRRIPDSADILALYEVQVDEDGELTGYRRLRRYPRGRTDPANGG